MFTSQARGGLALLGSAFILGTFGFLVRVLSEMFGTYAQVTARMALAFLILLAINLIYMRAKSLTRKELGLSLLLGLNSTAVLSFFTIAILTTKVANTVFLLYCGSILISLFLGAVLYRESFGAQKMIALVLALIGLYMYSDSLIVLGLGTVAAILSGVFEGVGNVVRKALQGVDKPTVLQWQFLGCSISAFILTLAMPEPIIKNISIVALVALLAFALCQIALNTLLLYGFQHFDVNIGSIILSTEVFFAAVMGYLLYGEILTTPEIIGGTAIFIASIIATINFAPKPSADTPVSS